MSEGGDVARVPAGAITRRLETVISDAPARVIEEAETSPARCEQISTYYKRLYARERATATAGGIVTRRRRDAVYIGGSVERLSAPRDRARPTEIHD